MFGKARLREVEAALDEAADYHEWLQAARAHDELTGADAWRADDEDSHVDARTIRSHIAQIRKLQEQRRALELAALLRESLYRHATELSDASLYAQALAGPKHFVDDFLAESCRALIWLASAEIPGMTREEQRAQFEQAYRVYGRSALMLSGGATLGFHHLGVVKGLFELGLLPSILSGASTGAMVAAGVCARSDDELQAMFDDPDQIRLDGLRRLPLSVGARQGSMLDPTQLEAVLEHNIGAWTFAEARARSGRTLAISVSPTRTHQKPRLLSALTAPDLLVVRAVLASSALPGLFPPVELEGRSARGDRVTHVPGETWVDGSIYGDLPKLRLARLFNVNHFVVSQTNPHVLPWVRHHGQRGLRPALHGLARSAVRSHGAWGVDVFRRATARAPGPLRSLAEQSYALVHQDYRGDITVVPQFRWSLYRKVLSNPTRDDLDGFIDAGRRSVWPLVAQIRDQTRIRRAFEEALAGPLGTRAGTG